jgi:hypothetical protein
VSARLTADGRVARLRTGSKPGSMPPVSIRSRDRTRLVVSGSTRNDRRSLPTARPKKRPFWSFSIRSCQLSARLPSRSKTPASSAETLVGALSPFLGPSKDCSNRRLPFRRTSFLGAPREVILPAVGSHTNPKRERGPQPISSLTLRVSISRRCDVSAWSARGIGTESKPSPASPPDTAID